MFRQNINRNLWATMIFVVALHWTASLQAAPGNIADSPIFADSNVPPNVFFEVDDSGSMDWEVLTKKYWHYCSYDRDTTGNTGSGNCGFIIDNGLFRLYSGTEFQYYEYLYDANDNAYSTGCNSSRQTLYLCNTAVQNADWRIRSSDVNVLYYDPDVTYLPWQGTGMTNANFTSARSDPQSTASGYSDLINLGTFNGGFVYEVWVDSHSFDASDGRPRRGTNINRKAVGDSNYIAGFVDLWDEHVRFTVTSNSILVDRITYSPDSNGHLNEAVTRISTLTGTQTLNGATIAEVQQNIANWYQYYRRRSFVAKAAIGKVITGNPENRYGLNFINNTDFPFDGGNTRFVEVPTGTTAFISHNANLLTGLFSLNWPANGTPLRRGLERVGQYFDHNSLSKPNDPIEYQCQQNFSVLLTDGYWNGGDPNNSIGDEDGDGYNEVSVADVAKYYYDRDLSSKSNNVPTNIFDLASYQHLVTYTVAFGVKGSLIDSNNDGWPDNGSNNFSENDDWGDFTNSGSPEKINDLWHAAFNSKGAFVAASTPIEVSKALTKAIGSVGDRLGTGASVAFNTTSLKSGSNIFLAQFRKQGNKWAGELLSYSLDPITGDISATVNWNAATELNSLSTPVTSRKIITYDKSLVVNSNTGNGIPFLWTNLTTSQKNDLRVEPNGTLSSDDAKAQARLNFLRGDRSNEITNQGTYSFRDRLGLLGDVVHSDPAFVKEPNKSWPASSPFPSVSGASYIDYVINKTSRSGVIYVGANDGMLHAFSESTGAELLAYIPSYLFSSASSSQGLHFLTDPDYLHRYYVDLPVTVSDVYIDKGDGVNEDSLDGDKDWHTVLIGGSRAGGRGIFALDITDPSSFSEANAANLVLWEFTNSDDPDLGLTFSKPTIAMMNNGRWAAIFGNGYNNTGDGKAKLFIVFLDGGVDGVWTDGSVDSSGNATPVDYIELDTGVGTIVGSDCLDSSSDCNGLSTPHAVDLDGNYTIDRVYAGDIQGNLWAFDVSATTSITTNWKSAYVDGSGVAKPLFIASSLQPIMDKPITIKHPEIGDSSSPSNSPNLMVFFGTGQYLTSSDVSTVPTIPQSFYGVWDHGVQELTPSDLVEQTFDSSTTFLDVNDVDVTDKVRVLSNNTVDYAGGDDGWKINFNISGVNGERVIVDPDLHAGLVFFNTWIPDTTPCNSGGGGFLMSVEQVNGGAPDTNDPAFDFNGDGTIDSNDLVKDASDPSQKFAPVGEKFNLGLPASSSIISDNQYTPGSNSNSQIHKRLVRGGGGGGPQGPGGINYTGRISWKELRK